MLILIISHLLTLKYDVLLTTFVEFQLTIGFPPPQKKKIHISNYREYLIRFYRYTLGDLPALGVPKITLTWTRLGLLVPETKNPELSYC